MPSQTRVSSRHKARQAAVQALYWLESQPWDEPGEAVRSVAEETNLDSRALKLANVLCRAARDGEARYSRELAAVSENWDADRIGRLERIILRLALAEWDMADPDTPPKVVLNEALNLTREFCGEDAARFVNGILDRLGRDRGLLAGVPRR